MSITIVIVGTTNHSLMKFSVEKTRKAVPHDCIKIFSDVDLGIPHSNFYKLKESFSRNDYSVFMMKELSKFIETDYAIVIQYDGFAVNSHYWENKFLDYDYIGSPTHVDFSPIKDIFTGSRLAYTNDTRWYSLGGGFSLRSRKFLNAIKDPLVDVGIYNYDTKNLDICEDFSIAAMHKNYLETRYKIKYGSIEDSLKFSSEILKGYNYCVGFHGWEQIPFFLNQDECIFYIDEHIKFEGGVTKINPYRLRMVLGNSVTVGYSSFLRHMIERYNVSLF